MQNTYTRFQHLLQEKFNGTHTVKATASKSGIPATTLYNYVSGVNTCPADLIAPIYNATKDADFLNFIIDDTDKMLVDKAVGKGEKTILDETLDVTVACGELAKTVQKAMRDGGIPTKERHGIVRAINNAEKELEDLRKKVRGETDDI